MWTYNNELYHHGIIGMKWGKRNGPPYPLQKSQMSSVEKQTYKIDKKKAKSLRKDLAADKRVMKYRARLNKKAEDINAKAAMKYSKVLSKPSLSVQAANRRIETAKQRIASTSKTITSTRGERVRAERIYKEDAKKYVDHVNSMMEKYGKDMVKDVSTRQLKVGKSYVKEVIKTGFTAEYLPLIGAYLTQRRVAPKDFVDRDAVLDRNTHNRYY